MNNSPQHDLPKRSDAVLSVTLQACFLISDGFALKHFCTATDTTTRLCHAFPLMFGGSKYLRSFVDRRSRQATGGHPDIFNRKGVRGWGCGRP